MAPWLSGLRSITAMNHRCGGDRPPGSDKAAGRAVRSGVKRRLTPITIRRVPPLRQPINPGTGTGTYEHTSEYRRHFRGGDAAFPPRPEGRGIHAAILMTGEVGRELPGHLGERRRGEAPVAGYGRRVPPAGHRYLGQGHTVPPCLRLVTGQEHLTDRALHRRIDGHFFYSSLQPRSE